MITEALLEMHFHTALVKLFSDTFGARVLRLIKPSTQREAWLGFDQGWVWSDSKEDIEHELKKAIQSGSRQVDKFYLGFFLQFKVVQKMLRNSSRKPHGYILPYYRSELSLKPNKQTGLSQHKTLLKLRNIKNAFAFYACPMMFDADEVYDMPDLNNLRLVDISEAPIGWTEGHKHCITFQTIDDAKPSWCSEPIEGTSYSIEEWVSEKVRDHLIPLNVQQLLELLNDTYRCLAENEDLLHRKQKMDKKMIFPESMLIIELEKFGS